MNKVLITYARHDFQLSISPVFIPIARGGRGKHRMEVNYKNKNGKIKVVSPWKLDIADESVLLAIIAIAGPRGKILSIGSKHERAIDFRKSLNEKEERETLAISTSLYEICKLIGNSTGGKAKENVEKSLERLAATTIFIEVAGEKWNSKILSFRRDKKLRLRIALNACSSNAILFNDINYTKIDLTERAGLKNDTTKAIHRRLSALVWPSHSTKVGVDTLIKGVFGEKDFEEKNMGKRRERVRKALRSINEYPAWKIKVENNMVNVWRKNIKP